MAITCVSQNGPTTTLSIFFSDLSCFLTKVNRVDSKKRVIVLFSLCHKPKSEKSPLRNGSSIRTKRKNMASSFYVAFSFFLSLEIFLERDQHVACLDGNVWMRSEMEIETNQPTSNFFNSNFEHHEAIYIIRLGGLVSFVCLLVRYVFVCLLLFSLNPCSGSNFLPLRSNE